MRNLGLDLLRLLAVVLVLGRHLQLPKNPNWFLATWHTGGWVGVDLFFVLSGFLVSGLLYKEYQRQNEVHLTRFLIRRGFKIYPPFYILIAFTIAVSLLKHIRLQPSGVVGEMLFVQNYVGSLWNHTWSLAVEEHFYIGIAIIVAVLTRRHYREKDPFTMIPALFVIVAAFCLLTRILTAIFSPIFSYDLLLHPTHIRIDSLMFGVVLSYFWHFKNLQTSLAKIPNKLLLLSALGLFAPAFVFPLDQYIFIPVFGYVMFYMGSGLLLLLAIRLKGSRNRLLISIGSLGASSYSIYLWHMPINAWAWPFVRKILHIESFASYFLFYTFGSLIFGYTMSKIIEWPILGFRDRVFPRFFRESGLASNVKSSVTATNGN